MEVERLAEIRAALDRGDHDEAYRLVSAISVAFAKNQIGLSNAQRAEVSLAASRALIGLGDPAAFEEAAEHLLTYAALAGTLAPSTLITVARTLLDLSNRIRMRADHDPDGVLYARYRGQAFEYVERCRLLTPTDPAVDALRRDIVAIP